MKEQPRYVRVADAITLLCCKRTKLYELTNEGVIETKHFGGSTLVSIEAINRFLDSLPVAKPRSVPCVEHRANRRKGVAAHG